MLSLRLVLPSLICLLSLAAWASASPEVTKQARQFVEDHEKRLKALDTAAAEAWWQASTTGSKEAFKKKVDAQNKIDEALSDRKGFARLKGLKDNRKEIDDPVLARAIDVLYLLY